MPRRAHFKGTMPKSLSQITLPPLPVAKVKFLDAQENGLCVAIGSCSNYAGSFDALKVREYLGSYAVEMFDFYCESYADHPDYPKFGLLWHSILVARTVMWHRQ
jgi:hypothetical protein